MKCFKTLWSRVILVFFSCILSRLLTAINYIEDPDSLRFAQAVLDFDLSRMQPHFPAYPIFCAFVKGIYFFTDSYSFAFALTGGICTAVLILSGMALLEHFGQKKAALFFALLTFFNPLVYLMGNRFMPDLMGLSMLSVCFLFFFKDKKGLFCFAGMMLAGIRLSYLPALLPPLISLTISLFRLADFRSIFRCLVFGFAGFAFWFIPLLLDTGWEPLFEAARKQTQGHFNDFGGTIQTESQLGLRITCFFKHLWADGLGGYWAGRHFLHLGSSFLFLYLIPFGLKALYIHRKKEHIQIAVLSFLSYLMWIFLYQNIIFKARHHLPLVAGLILFLSISWSAQRHWKALFLPFLPLAISCIFLVKQHQNKVAAAQLKDYIEQSLHTDCQIIAPALMCFYLEKQGIKQKCISLEEASIPSGDFRIISNSKSWQGQTLVKDSVFHHNPYVNRLWHQVFIQKKLEK